MEPPPPNGSPVLRSSVLTTAAAGAALATVTAVLLRRSSGLLDDAHTRAERFGELVRLERLEQEEMAARLHDGPLQMVIAARQDLQEHLEGEDVDLSRTAAGLGEAIAGLRDLNTDLFDAVLRDSDLEAALARAGALTEQYGGPPVGVTVGPRTSGDHDALVVKVVNELLTNVRKHASASRAWVVVVRSPERGLCVTVGDDGVGMTTEVMREAARDGHLGLRSISRRVAAAGGVLRVRPLDPGTEVEVQVPLPPE